MFNGFRPVEENYFRLPNEWTDLTHDIKSLAELKVVEYVLRHTWGYGDTRKRITLVEFCGGRKKKDGTRLDRGTGLTKKSVTNGIRLAVEHGFLVVEQDDSDLGRRRRYYRLRREGERPVVVDQRGRKYPTEGEKVSHGGGESIPRSEKDTLGKKPLEKHLGPGRSRTNGYGLLNGSSTTTGTDPKLTPFDIEQAKLLKKLLIHHKSPLCRSKEATLAKIIYRLRATQDVSESRITKVIGFLKEAYTDQYTPRLYKNSDILEKFPRIEDAQCRYYGRDAWDAKQQKDKDRLYGQLKDAMGDAYDPCDRSEQEDVDAALVELGLPPGSVSASEF